MNTEQLAQFIASPELISQSDIPVLKELTEKHTYSSVLSLLYISAISRLQSIDLDQAIQQHAYRLSDRSRLYHLIHQKEQHELHIDSESESQNERAVTMTERVDRENPIIEEKKETSTIEEAEEMTEFSNETTAISIEQDYFAGIKKDETASIEQIVEHPKEPIVEEKRIEEQIIQQPEISDKKSFSDWLRSPQRSSKEEAVKLSKQQIIDQFIQKEPTISRPKAEFFSPSKKAKASLDEETVPISETLAKIYAAQGNFPKAIHVYHQLMLSYPEKKSLFAVAIEELKKKITP